MNGLQQTELIPACKNVVDGLPWWEAIRKTSPLTSSFHDVEHCIEDLAQRCSRASLAFGWRQNWLEEDPLGIG